MSDDAMAKSIREQIEGIHSCQNCERLRAELAAARAEIQRIYAVEVKQQMWILRARQVLEAVSGALVAADSELSAYGHGRPLDKAMALQVSDLCRSAYERARKEVVNERS